MGTIIINTTYPGIYHAPEPLCVCVGGVCVCVCVSKHLIGNPPFSPHPTSQTK